MEAGAQGRGHDEAEGDAAGDSGNQRPTEPHRPDERRSEELSDEVHMLEVLVQRLQERLNEPGEELRFPARMGGEPRQTGALMDTVREALMENRVDLYLQPVVNLPQRKTLFYEQSFLESQSMLLISSSILQKKLEKSWHN